MLKERITKTIFVLLQIDSLVYNVKLNMFYLAWWFRQS